METVLVFSLEENGELQLAKNFKVKEFACQDGSDTVFVDPCLVYTLQKVRDHFKRSVHINSAYRTHAHNEKVGGAARSYHLRGMAADFTVKGVKPATVREFLETLLSNCGGIGAADTYTHVDVRAEKARWNY